MTSPSYATAVSLNNKGVHLFSKGNFQKALPYFRAATSAFARTLAARAPAASADVATDGVSTSTKQSPFVCLNDVKSQEKRSNRPSSITSGNIDESLAAAGLGRLTKLQQEEAVASTTSTPSAAADDQGIALSPPPAPTAASSTARGIGQLNPSIFMISARAVLIGEAKNKTCYWSAAAPVNVTEIMSALTFNIALCFQMLGSSGPAPEKKNVLYRRNAVRFYKVSFSLRRKTTVSSTRTLQSCARTCEPNSLDLSILNNVGLLLFQTGHADKAIKCFEELSSGLNRVVVGGTSSRASQLDHIGFVKNLTILLPEKILASAA